MEGSPGKASLAQPPPSSPKRTCEGTLKTVPEGGADDSNAGREVRLAESLMAEKRGQLAQRAPLVLVAA